MAHKIFISFRDAVTGAVVDPGPIKLIDFNDNSEIKIKQPRDRGRAPSASDAGAKPEKSEWVEFELDTESNTLVKIDLECGWRNALENAAYWLQPGSPCRYEVKLVRGREECQIKELIVSVRETEKAVEAEVTVTACDGAWRRTQKTNNKGDVTFRECVPSGCLSVEVTPKEDQKHDDKEHHVRTELCGPVHIWACAGATVNLTVPCVREPKRKKEWTLVFEDDCYKPIGCFHFFLDGKPYRTNKEGKHTVDDPQPGTHYLELKDPRYALKDSSLSFAANTSAQQNTIQLKRVQYAVAVGCDLGSGVPDVVTALANYRAQAKLLPNGPLTEPMPFDPTTGKLNIPVECGGKYEVFLLDENSEQLESAVVSATPAAT
jgi:hypothetical protein